MKVFSNIGWQRRVRVFAIMTVAVFGLLFFVLRLISVDGLDPFGNAFVPDFVQFYVDGDMVTHGQWDQLYNERIYFERTNAFLGGHKLNVGFPPVYPPFVAWLYVPWSWTPYPVASSLYFAFNLSLAVGLGWSIARKLVPDPQWASDAGWLFLASLPAIRSLLYGQNGLISLAILWSGYLLWEQRRLVLSGMVLALGAYKPHLFFGAWVWLIFFSNWRATAGLALGGILLFLLGSITGDTANPWLTWIHALSYERDSNFIALERHSIWQAFAISGSCPVWLEGPRAVCCGIFALLWVGMLVWMRFRKSPEVNSLAWLVAIWGWVWVTPRAVQYDLVILYPAYLMAWSGLKYLPTLARKWQRRFLIAWVASFYVSDAFARIGIPLITILGVAIFCLICLEMRRRLSGNSDRAVAS